MSFLDFFNGLMQNPILILALGLILVTIAMNGIMDAPNSIATCVATRTLYVDYALIMSTVCNFLGVLAINLINTKVSFTIFNLVEFTPNNDGIKMFLATLLGIIIWGMITWKMNIPMSSSHSLIAGLLGASIATNKGFNGINFKSFSMVLIGIVISILFTFFIAKIIVKIIINIFKNKDRRDSRRFFDISQIVSGGLMSFVHGIHDGQKFIALIAILVSLMKFETIEEGMFPIWIFLICAIIMGIGTSIGIKRVVKSVGMNVVNLETYEGLSADLTSIISILVATFFGIPISTTQTSSIAIIGVGSVKSKNNVNWSYAKYLTITWFLTYPACGLIAFIIAKIFMIF